MLLVILVARYWLVPTHWRLLSSAIKQNVALGKHNMYKTGLWNTMRTWTHPHEVFTNIIKCIDQRNVHRKHKCTQKALISTECNTVHRVHACPHNERISTEYTNVHRLHGCPQSDWSTDLRVSECVHHVVQYNFIVTHLSKIIFGLVTISGRLIHWASR